MASSNDKYPNGWPQEKPSEETSLAFLNEFVDLCAKHKVSAGAVLLREILPKDVEKGTPLSLAYAGDRFMVRLLQYTLMGGIGPPDMKVLPRLYMERLGSRDLCDRYAIMVNTDLVWAWEISRSPLYLSREIKDVSHALFLEGNLVLKSKGLEDRRGMVMRPAEFGALNYKDGVWRWSNVDHGGIGHHETLEANHKAFYRIPVDPPL